MASLEDIAKKAADSAAKLKSDMLNVHELAADSHEEDTDRHQRIQEEAKQLNEKFKIAKQDSTVSTFIDYASKSMDLSDDETKRLVVAFTPMKQFINYNGIVLKCPGNHKCPHMNTCPFSEIQKFPKGELCPVEKMIADREMQEYLSIVTGQNLSVDDLPLSTINMIYTLIECDLTQIRMRSKINDDGYTKMRKIFNAKGGLLTEEEDISKAFEIHERVAKNKSTILKSLMFTPEIKKKYKVSDDNDRQMSPAEALMVAKQKLPEHHAGETDKNKSGQ